VSISYLHPEALKANRPCELFLVDLRRMRFVKTVLLLTFVLFVVLSTVV